MNTDQQTMYMRIELDRVKKIANENRVERYIKRNNIDYILYSKTNAGYSLFEVKKHKLNYHVFTTKMIKRYAAFIYADYLKLRLLDITEFGRHTLYFTEEKEIEYNIVKIVNYVNYVYLPVLQNVNLDNITSTFYMKKTEKECAVTTVYAFGSYFNILHKSNNDYRLFKLYGFDFNELYITTYESAVQIGLNALCATVHGYKVIV